MVYSKKSIADKASVNEGKGHKAMTTEGQFQHPVKVTTIGSSKLFQYFLYNFIED